MLTFSGSVSNNGTVTLTNVVVRNDAQANAIVFGPTNLAPGEIRFFTSSYTVPEDFCGPAVDTLTATATSICGPSVTNSATASCPVITAPGIRVTKSCGPAVGPGEILTFTGSVSNSGNVTLTNVVVTDHVPAPGEALIVIPVFGPVTLAPGEVRTFSGSYRTPADSCGPYVDTLIATATSRCGSNVTASATVSCTGVTTPRISITKSCPPDPVPFGGVLVYSGVVSNSGNVTLTNVTVVDNKPTNNTPVLGPITLAPGEWRAFTNSYVTPDEDCCPLHDTLTARGKDKCTGSNVMRTATAVCEQLRQPGLQVTRTCPAGSVTNGQTIVFSGIVTNSGNVALSNVVLVANDGTIIMTIPALSRGEWMDYEASFVVTKCPGLQTNTVLLTGNDVRTGVRVTSTAVCIVSCSGDSRMILSPMLMQGAFGVAFPSETDKSYTVEWTDSLNPPTQWRVLTNVMGDGGMLIVPDNRTNRHRFYRLVY